MNKRVFFVGLILWLALLAVGAKWSVNPCIYYYSSWIFGREDPTELAAKFPIHLAQLPDFGSPAAQVEAETFTEAADTNVREWALRETRNRGLVVLSLWTVTGFLIRWLAWRIQRGLTRLE